MAKKYYVFGGVLSICLLADQLSKEWVVRNLRYAVDEVPIIPGFLSMVHAQNTGAAFSSFDGQYTFFLVFVAVATVVTFSFLAYLRDEATFIAGVLGMILSGAWGNGLDRVRFGHVTDFIRVYTEIPSLKAKLIENFGTATWPIFNIADSVLLVGVSLFLVHYLFVEDTDTVDPEEADEELS